MDIRSILQDCLLLLFFLPFHYGISIDEDYEEAVAIGRCPWIRNKLKNGRVRYRYKGRVAKFLCDSGFELAGKRSATCVRGQWSNPLPVCVARGCNRVPTIANGRVTEMYRGALLVYDCNPGYTLAGDYSIHCDGRRWNATPPSCVVSIQDPETHCDFETYDLCGWTHDPIHDFDWRRNQFATPSGHVGTGPSFDHTFGENKAGYYLYIEASSPRKPNDVARLFSPVYHSEESGGCFTFWYHMYGTNTGGLRVYLKPESYVFNELSPKWQEFGDHGNQWLRGNLSVPVFRENFQIVIEGVRGDGYMGDSAIDDVYLTKQDCENMDNETDIHSEDSIDSCRGRCRGSDSADACGCNENCHAADNCCADYMSLCFEANDTLVPDTDEVPGDYFGKTSSFATVSAILSESTNAQTQAISTNLPNVTTNQLSFNISLETPNSAPSSSNFPDPTTSSVFLVTSSNPTEESVSSSFATTSSTSKSLTPEKNPVTLFPSSPTAYDPLLRITDTTLSSTTEKATHMLTSTVETITPLKFSATTTALVKTSLSTTSIKASLNTTTSVKSSPSTATSIKTPSTTISVNTFPSTTISVNTFPSTTTSGKTSTSTLSSVKTSPSTSTSIKISPSMINGMNTNSVVTTTESILRTTQKAFVSTMQISSQTASTNSTRNQPLSSVTSTQDTKTIHPTTLHSTTESSTFSKLAFSNSTSVSTTTVIPNTSTPRYNLRPRKTTVVSSTPDIIKNSFSSTSKSFSSTTTTSKSETTTAVNIGIKLQKVSLPSTTKPSVFTARIFTWKPTQVATTKSSIIQNNTIPNTFKTTRLRIPRPSILTFPSTAPTATRSFEMISSKSTDSSATIITVVIILLICVVGGVIFYIKKYRGKRQSKLDDDSEMRFLPDSDYMEYSDASALEKIMVK